MSGKVSGWVWDLELPQNEKFVLLAYADHADHDGHNVFPSVGLIARKTGYSHRSIQRIVKSLISNGHLLPDGKGVHGTNKYSIPLPVGGDTMTPPPIARGDTMTQGGDKLVALKGDIAIAPEPSLTVNNKETSVASRKRDARLDHPAIIEYRKIAHLHVPITWRDAVIETVGDEPNNVMVWGELVLNWIGHGWNKANIKDMLDAHKNGGIEPKFSKHSTAARNAALLEEVMNGNA